MHEKVVVLYVGGEGRSGSTVLSALLGRASGLVSVGELRGIWQAIKTNELCGCGLPFNQCGFWTGVGDRAFGGWANVDVESMLRLDRTFARHRSIPRLLISRDLWAHRSEELDSYRAVLRSLYTAVKEVSQCTVVVDSTKDPSYAFLLNGVDGIDLRVVHLVRDSRGVAYSWNKANVERPEYRDHPSLSKTFMEHRAFWKSAVLWNAKNLLFHLLGFYGVTRDVERYESFVASPEATIQRIVRVAIDESERDTGSVPGELPAAGEFTASPHHTIGGNRVRFARGTIRLRVDEEWRLGMGRKPRLLVSLLTFPLLSWYGYETWLRMPASRFGRVWSRRTQKPS